MQNGTKEETAPRCTPVRKRKTSSPQEPSTTYILGVFKNFYFSLYHPQTHQLHPITTYTTLCILQLFSKLRSLLGCGLQQVNKKIKRAMFLILRDSPTKIHSFGTSNLSLSHHSIYELPRRFGYLWNQKKERIIKLRSMPLKLHYRKTILLH